MDGVDHRNYPHVRQYEGSAEPPAGDLNHEFHEAFGKVTTHEYPRKHGKPCPSPNHNQGQASKPNEQQR
jgi:hypothetical protein